LTACPLSHAIPGRISNTWRSQDVTVSVLKSVTQAVTVEMIINRKNLLKSCIWNQQQTKWELVSIEVVLNSIDWHKTLVPCDHESGSMWDNPSWHWPPSLQVAPNSVTKAMNPWLYVSTTKSIKWTNLTSKQKLTLTKKNILRLWGECFKDIV
jgi:hypothetical protein